MRRWPRRREGRPLRIAYVIPAYPPLTSQPFVVNEMVEVQEAGHEVVVLGLYPAPGDPVRHGTFARLQPVAVLPTALVDLPTLGLALAVAVRHPVRTIRTLAGLHWAAGLNPWQQAKVFAVAAKGLAASARLRRLGVRHVHAHFANQTADCAAIAGEVGGIPFSFTAHAYDIYSTDRRQRNETLGWKLRHARRAFTVNGFARDMLRGHLPAAVQDRVQISYVGIPMHLFRPEPMPSGGSELRLVAVARFQEKKGLDTLLDACGLLRDRAIPFRLAIYGDGALRADLEAQRARLGLEALVDMPGSVPQEEVARQLRASHVFVLPCRQDSQGDMDGIPTVFMEAMATGRPVVSCPLSGIPELVRDGETGLLVPSNDPRALADALERLAREEPLRVRLGQGARALVERQHDQATNARRLIAWVTTEQGPDAAS